MAIFIRKSVFMGNREPTTPPIIPNDIRLRGRNFDARDRILTVTGDSAGSMYGFFTLRSDAVVVSAKLSNEAMSASTTMDLGLYEDADHGGFSATTGWLTTAGAVVGAEQFFGDAVAFTNAQTKQEQLLANTNFYTLANCTKRVWEVLGLASDPNREYVVVATVESATVVLGANMLIEISYKLQ